MASIVFTDATGTATLTNVHAAVVAAASRFENWQPRPRPVGDTAVAVGTGTTYTYAFRTDYGASFELRDIAISDMAIMDRFVLHFVNGGTFTVNTTDAAARSYTCKRAPDAEPPYPEKSDPVMNWYTMRFSVINTASAPLLCIY